MKIVSGKTGSPHVTSYEFRQIIEGAIGQGSYILKSGDNLEPELVSNNLLKIKSGMISHHGNVSSVENYDEIELMNGTQGMKRIDLIVNRYTRNDETKIEDNSWVCIVGMPDASSPEVPAYTEGNLQDGDLVDDCPFAEVHFDGINVTEVKQLVPVARNTEELEAELDELNGKIDSHISSITTIQNMKVAVGSKVVTASVTSSIVAFTLEQLNTLFGVTNCSNTNTACFFSNGDGNAQTIRVVGGLYKNSNWYATFDGNAAAGNIRINYMVIYFGTE